MTIKGLVFDLDGVIADTHEFHYASWKRLADEENLLFTREDNDALRGLSRENSLKRLLGNRQISESDALEMMERKNRYFHETMRQIQPLPGVVNLLDEARAAGLRIALGSVSRNARYVLNALNLTDQFDAIGDGYTVINPKPAPDIFIWAAGALHLPPYEVAVLEDSAAGIEAALTGGFSVIGIGSTTVQQAHVIYPSLANVTLADLLSRLPARFHPANRTVHT